jgi:hypothetical protein
MQCEKPNAGAVEPENQRTEKEKAAVKKHRDRVAAEPTTPRLKFSKSATASEISLDHPDPALGASLLAEALGTANYDFMNGLLKQIANASSQGREIDEQGVNFLLSVVTGVKPRDQIEAMLAAQMGVIHTAIMTFGRRLSHVDTLPQQDSAERALNKLARTFAMQVEALKRYRTGGEQKVTVQHVSVSDGGQAIVGNVTHAARAPAPEENAPLSPALAPPQQSPMTVINKPERAPTRSRRTQKNGN